ncbi:F-box only protein 2 [Microcaecilia unicolor]|uniref:F-box only protein 2 n=1 Tax=Microcaecilia unicolor TaxID=1415580 RepID=A0A6P7WVE2_9AMPH|nr:F-box only protein 2 [Microcaecilia unicolor]XP_030041839.1 F-box only protein 2 [Microcaecilia unicolor]
MEVLPEAILTRIMASLPAEELVLVCRLVCRQWKDIVDAPAVWILKCQEEGFSVTEERTEEDNWQIFFFLSKKKRNLIRNPCGEEGFDFWEDMEHGGDGWKIEDLPGDCGSDFPSEAIQKYFVTSHGWCSKSQVIDLLEEGYWADLMDTTQPDIVVTDWYAPRSDSGCLYELCVQLLSENRDVLTEYKSETITIPQFNDANWNQISHTFSSYGPGVRFVRFQHGGQDTMYWKGWFGVRVTHSNVTIHP